MHESVNPEPACSIFFCFWRHICISHFSFFSFHRLKLQVWHSSVFSWGDNQSRSSQNQIGTEPVAYTLCSKNRSSLLSNMYLSILSIGSNSETGSYTKISLV